ncbi:bifunctional 2-C-methyl-D-erythritol 4-phosphate cytidylyltransferase/2-C-methyl-D-erythritol 2,4-cyclodiphosphate synthase [Thioclava sp. SK-1]|uniref:bifunctional 2-C-methyl-D-erythritol 4-phosphate cytidylyltransferase/2-C-methyl-D-erythritol 2,4-cyclodiphosphate synthase n=1 Tax=Thioclava sp. SK-1 TaxID=1889770 RepID=UPI000824A955|nr:bifunctional 2-C-methyl-D-erythritol 4-phosphate cytidylyltransferase/2-C-methyl-D-erythritol 2,4-cyclodiphosphate synthase [Thioclava sp. SK-1]OCX63097.1 bifunctional 2-C-methyl-D-erythritol 4-phosphate cytidylyltransferase/2-C-methyl-D-erythritol 2,4-cyclodiphosphate synthase [Thioclava sp. SK-1]
MTTAVIIVAAGRGTRAGGGLPKQWRDLAGLPVLAHTVAAFAPLKPARIVVVLHPDDMLRGLDLFNGAVTLISGGDSRDLSVQSALEALAGTDVTKVLIHDGARPLVPFSVIQSVLDALDTHVAAAPALPVTDALWHGAGGYVTGTRDRSTLYRAQTPQGFHFDTILNAHRAHPGGAADDVAVARDAGHQVAITPGSEDNIKLTYPDDFARAEALIRGQAKEHNMDIRLGNGYDVHAFTSGDAVILCGVSIPHDKALLGHSDADVGMHALTDAIYGALAQGDIGRHFPPSDPQWKGAASWIFLDHAAKLARSKGFRIGNVDVTLICERPKIGPHAPAMMAELARIIDTPVDRVSVKATTSEQLGFTGREEGIAAIATVTLIQS